ncbi:MAG TPA: tRNA (adenosine(37)-N6)-dimethylallyltransferase MiaA [Bacteroidetes bacterium]|nr:tRNA (adenosine(37)-N6)-dimethylallyltransferase MiaA [Bacteroidota bacterium]
MKATSKNLIVVSGPTASGKTDVAIALAKSLNTEIISADSRQFYREIPIGTTAPDAHQLAEVKHYFVGHLSVKDDYNVSRFENDVLQLLKNLFRTTDAVIMVGGSGLYIDAVCKGIDELPDPDDKLRNRLNELFETKGIEALKKKLQTLDPEYYRQVDLNNPKRLMRAIEVCLQTGKPYSEQRLNRPKKRDFNIIKIGMDVPREVLNEHIGHRTHLMLDKGWLEEARQVYPLRKYNALNTVGYKELFKYFDGEWDLDTATQKIITNTCRYAKRQMTWFRKDTEITWFAPSETDRMIGFIKDNIKR